MNTRRLFTTLELAQVVGMDREWVTKWIRSGSLEPAVRGGPGGFGRNRRPHWFTLSQVIGVVIARGLMAYGLPGTVAGEVLDSLLSTSPDALEAAFLRGRTYLLILGHEVIGLRSKDEVQKSTAVAAAQAAALPVLMIDVAAVARNVEKKVAEVVSAPAPAVAAEATLTPAEPAGVG